MHDDICIFGKTKQEHDENLPQLMKTASKMALYLIPANTTSVNHKYPFMLPNFQHKEWNLTPTNYKPYKTFLHHRIKKN